MRTTFLKERRLSSSVFILGVFIWTRLHLLWNISSPNQIFLWHRFSYIGQANRQEDEQTEWRTAMDNNTVSRDYVTSPACVNKSSRRWPTEHFGLVRERYVDDTRNVSRWRLDSDSVRSYHLHHRHQLPINSTTSILGILRNSQSRPICNSNQYNNEILQCKYCCAHENHSTITAEINKFAISEYQTLFGN